MSLELSLRFPDPSHLIVSFDGQDTSPLDFTSPLTERDHYDIRWYLETYATQYTTDADDQEAQRIAAKLPVWGQALFDAAFTESSAKELFLDFRKSTQDTRLLTISADHPSVLSLPWELLHDGTCHFCDSTPRISVRRVAAVEDKQETVPPPTKSHLRLLFVVSRPSNAGFIDPRSDAQAIMDGLAETVGEAIEVEFLCPATLPKLVERLQDQTQPPVDIIHFDGHGAFDEKGEFGDSTPHTGYLLFESFAGLKRYVSPTFWKASMGEQLVPLVVLSACESSTVGGEESLGSVAAGLTAIGIPAVIAMSYKALVPTTRTLFGQFYQHLAQGLGVGAALNDARDSLRQHPEKREVQRGSQRQMLQVHDWFLPTLYQGGEDVPLLQHTDAATQPILPETENPIRRTRHNLPTLREESFWGRTRELWEIERWFAGGTRRVSVTGFGGQGKTALTAEAGRWLLRTGMFERVVFVSYQNIGSLDPVDKALLEMRPILEESFPNAEGAALALSRTRTLLILDNLEDVPADSLHQLLSVAKIWSECGDSRVWLTSRTPDFYHDAFSNETGLQYRHKQLDGLTEADALNFFQAVMKAPPEPQVTLPKRGDLLALFGMVNYHPLSLRLISEQIKTRYLEDVREHLATLLAEEGGDKDSNLRASLRLSLDRLDWATRSLLPRLSVLQGGAFEASLLSITQIPEIEWSVMRQTLQLASLIEVENLESAGIPTPYIRFHPILSPLLWEHLQPQERELLSLAHRECYHDVAGFLYNQDPTQPERVRIIARRELPNLLRALQSAVDAGEVDATNFADNIIHFLDKMELRQDGRFLGERVIAQAMVRGEVGSERWFIFQSKLGENELKRGAVHTALKLFHEISTVLGSTPSYKRCITLARIGRCLEALGHLVPAENSYREVLSLADTLGQTDLIQQLKSTVLTGMGNVMRADGKFEKAHDLYLSALDIDESIDHLGGQAVINGQLGFLALEEENLTEAFERYEKSLKMFQQLTEPRQEAIAHHQLGLIFQKAGQWHDAEHHYREAAGIKESLGMIHGPSGALRTWNLLALVLQLSGNPNAAETWFRKALKAAREGGRTFDALAMTSTLLNNFSGLLLTQPDGLREAQDLAEESLAIRKNLDPTVAEIWKTHELLARIADQQNKTHLAREHRHQARVAYRNFTGSRRRLQDFEPLIDAVVTTLNNPEHRPDLEVTLARWEDEWTDLVSAIRHMLEGERSVDTLYDSLDFEDSLVVETILERLAPQ